MIRVLVVDDDPLVRRSLANVLARSGYDVSTADNAERALKLAEIAPPSLAIVDFNMPGGGLAIVRALKERDGDAIHVAILTGYDGDALRAECRAAGADEVLAKPIAPIELRRRLAAACARLAIAPVVAPTVATAS